MGILGIQKRARELGRIRIGINRKGRPEKIQHFRLTSPSRDLLEAAAKLYGGEVKPWTPHGGGAAQYELDTTTNRIPIFVPPGPVTQWMETWKAGGCVHRCDGETNVLTDERCDPNDRDHINAKPTTRLNVILCEVEGMGYWRLETHGWNAAAELPEAAEFLSQVGGYIDGELVLEQRTSKSYVDGKPTTRHYMVPGIHIKVTPAELMAGKGRVTPAALTGGPVDRLALEAPSSRTPNPPPATGPAPATTPREDPLREFLDALTATETVAAYVAVWDRGVKAGLVGNGVQVPEEFMHAAAAHGSRLQAAEKAVADAPPGMAAPAPQEPPQDGPDQDGAYAVEHVEQTADEEREGKILWDEILEIAGGLGHGLRALNDHFYEAMGKGAIDATNAELRSYRDRIATGGMD